MSNGDLWITASADVEKETHDRVAIAIRQEADEFWPLLASSSSAEDFSNRLALVASKLDAIVARHTPETASFFLARSELENELISNFAKLDQARTAAEKCTVCGKPATKYIGGQEGYSASGHHVCDAHAHHFDKSSSRKHAARYVTMQCSPNNWATKDQETDTFVNVFSSPEAADACTERMNGKVASRKRASLNDQMEFDCVVEVKPDGSVVDAPNVYGPSLYDDELEGSEWTLMDGYSGQFGYSGPIMHDSEFIGGGLERDILAQPGYYVALVNYSLDDDEPEGWAVAYKPSGTTASRKIAGESDPYHIGRIKGNVTLDQVKAYLPSNYRATQVEDGTIYISGNDDAGWTWEGYVLPRLGSGLIGVEEVTNEGAGVTWASRRTAEGGVWECYGCGKRLDHLNEGWNTQCPSCGSYEIHLTDSAKKNSSRKTASDEEFSWGKAANEILDQLVARGVSKEWLWEDGAWDAPTFVTVHGGTVQDIDSGKARVEGGKVRYNLTASSHRKTALSDPIGYTYEADVHCPSCTEAKFGRGADGFIASDAVDSEGNSVGVIAPWDEGTPFGEYCADCGVEISPPNGLDTEGSRKTSGFGDVPFTKDDQGRWIPPGDPRIDGETGEVTHDWATCGNCGRTWDDSVITGITPSPGAMCPFCNGGAVEGSRKRGSADLTNADLRELADKGNELAAAMLKIREDSGRGDDGSQPRQSSRKTAYGDDNWDTGEVKLQFANDYELYLQVKNSPGDVTSDDVRALWGDEDTSPNGSVDVSAVDWQSVADSINEDRHEGVYSSLNTRANESGEVFSEFLNELGREEEEHGKKHKHHKHKGSVTVYVPCAKCDRPALVSASKKATRALCDNCKA